MLSDHEQSLPKYDNGPLVLARALGILHRMRVENTGWKSFFRRWYYSDEPLRNDASNLLFEIGYDDGEWPEGTQDINARVDHFELCDKCGNLMLQKGRCILCDVAPLPHVEDLKGD